MIRQSLLALTLTSASPALAEMPILQIPIDCDLNGPCFIQQYMDRDRSPTFQDYQCAPLSYNGHRGTDFALPNREMMRQGVSVLAAAPGIVRGYRDGMPDTGLSEETETLIRRRACGNGLVIEHEDGWSTQYCHLKQGSIVVAKGQSVAAGDVLGQVGQSGRAEFPHVHFSLRKNDIPIDPFDPDGTLECNAPGDSTAWAETPAYRPGGIIEVGFTTAVPVYDDIKEGTAAVTKLGSKAPAIVTYAFSFGTRAGDVLKMRIDGPDGAVITHDTDLTRNHAQAFRAIGKKRRIGRSWPLGTYTATATLLRDGDVINTLSQDIEIAE